MSNQAPQSNTSDDREDYKLKLAGAGYIVGDAAMFAAAAVREKSAPKIGKLFGASSWLVGGLGAAFYGNPDIDTQLKIHSHRLEQFLKQKGVVIPSEAREQSELLRDKGLWDNISLFLHEHPSQILNAGYLVGALGILAKDVKPDFTKGMTVLPKSLTNWSNVSNNFWIGTLVTLGALAGLLIKEDPNAKEKAKNGNAVDKVVAFATENPLRISSGLYFLNNLPLLGMVLKDHEHGGFKNKALLFSSAQLGLYLMSNTLLFMSPKEQTTKHGFTAAEISKLEEATLLIVSSQPKEVQAALIKDVSEYMSKQPGIKLSAQEIESQLIERLEKVATTTPAERRFAAREAQRATDRANQQAPSM